MARPNRMVSAVATLAVTVRVATTAPSGSGNLFGPVAGHITLDTLLGVLRADSMPRSAAVSSMD